LKVIVIPKSNDSRNPLHMTKQLLIFMTREDERMFSSQLCFMGENYRRRASPGLAMAVKPRWRVVLLFSACILLSAAKAPAAMEGTVVGCGGTTLPDVAPGTRYTQIAAGNFYNLALTSHGRVIAWGMNRLGEGMVPPTLLTSP
jgi:hypothetical protein